LPAKSRDLTTLAVSPVVPEAASARDDVPDRATEDAAAETSASPLGPVLPVAPDRACPPNWPEGSAPAWPGS